MPKKILIIEDDPEILQITKHVLELNGYVLSTALDGEAGLQKTKQEMPDVVILDLGLPKINGKEVCKEIKKTEKTKNIPVIILSGRNSDADKIIGKVIGADYYMTKPFQFEELLENITALFKE